MPSSLPRNLTAAVKAVPWLHALLRPAVNFYRRARDPHHRETMRFRKYCELVGARAQQPMFVKVGANDGTTGDPCSDLLLANSAWKGVLIEPVPYCFEKLKLNFGNAERFKLEQVAIGSASGSAKFYFVDAGAALAIPNLPPYYDQLGSFDRGHIVKHLDGALEPFIVARDVEVSTLSEVFRRNSVGDLHLLHIDVEGYDYEVLKTLDLSAYRPVMILIEHKHLDFADRNAMDRLLRSNGYELRDCGTDLFALHVESYEGIRRRPPRDDRGAAP